MALVFMVRLAGTKPERLFRRRAVGRLMMNGVWIAWNACNAGQLHSDLAMIRAGSVELRARSPATTTGTASPATAAAVAAPIGDVASRVDRCSQANVSVGLSAPQRVAAV